MQKVDRTGLIDSGKKIKINKKKTLIKKKRAHTHAVTRSKVLSRGSRESEARLQGDAEEKSLTLNLKQYKFRLTGGIHKWSLTACSFYPRLKKKGHTKK